MSDVPPRVSPGRQDFGPTIGPDVIKKLAADPTLRVLQTAEPVDQSIWETLNDFFIPQRPDVQIRVYGFYSVPCDLQFLKWLPNLSNFSADCLMDAKSTEFIGGLQNLQRLSIGIFSLQNFDFLHTIPPEKLTRLVLGSTRSKRPDLAVLKRFNNLRELYVEGQQKGLESIATLGQLRDLTLRSVSSESLSFLKPLQHLWSLDIKLGGITDLSALNGMAQIKYLELWQIKGLSNIDVISSLVGLQNLFLQSLRNVTTIPDLSQLTQLRRIYLENMKGLTDLSGLRTAPALEEFIHVMANLDPLDYEPLLDLPSLKRAGAWFGSDKKNVAFRALATKRHIEDYTYREFIYS